MKTFTILLALAAVVLPFGAAMPADVEEVKDHIDNEDEYHIDNEDEDHIESN